MGNEYAEVQDTVNNTLAEHGKVMVIKAAKDHGIELVPGMAQLVEQSEKTHSIILPSEMNKLQGAFNLLKQYQEEETTRIYNRAYAHFFLNDFIITMQKLIPKYFGMLHVSRVDTQGQKASTDYIQIPVGYDAAGNTRTEKGYIGSITAPCWEGAIIDISPASLAIKAKMKFEKQVNAFLEEVETTIKSSSIVKGESVSVAVTRNGLIASPIKAKLNSKIVLSPDVDRIVNNLVIPSLRDKVKRSILFTGDFGTGKTETAIKVGLEGQRRYDRTFFYLENANTLGNLIPYIKNYQPCLVFCEDVDQISSGDRDSTMNTLLNQIDGNELKNVDCTFVFTTNNHDKIHPAMRRPGRIDQVVHFDYCTTESIAKIFELYAEGWEGAADVDYMKAAEACPPKLQGAMIAEIARQAMKYSEHLHGKVVSTDRFLDAISSMKHHIEFMRDDQKVDHSAENLLAHVLYKSMKKAFPQIDTGVSINEFTGSPYADLQG